MGAAMTISKTNQRLAYKYLLTTANNKQHDKDTFRYPAKQRDRHCRVVCQGSGRFRGEK